MAIIQTIILSGKFGPFFSLKIPLFRSKYYFSGWNLAKIRELRLTFLYPLIDTKIQVSRNFFPIWYGKLICGLSPWLLNINYTIPGHISWSPTAKRNKNLITWCRSERLFYRQWKIQCSRNHHAVHEATSCSVFARTQNPNAVEIVLFFSAKRNSSNCSCINTYCPAKLVRRLFL